MFSGKEHSAGSPHALSPYEIDLVREGFVSLNNYDEVQDREQTTSDWIRNIKLIYLNDYPLDEIVKILKKENLKNALSDYLYQDLSSVEKVQKRIDALKEVSIQLKGNHIGLDHLKATEECLLVDSFILEMLEKLIIIVFNLDIQKQNQKVYELTNSPEMDELKNVVKKAGYYFSTELITNSATTLRKIWEDFLFVRFAPTVNKDDFADILFRFAHQGGILFALFSAHLQHLDKTKYLIEPSKCINASRIDFVCREDNIVIVESTPIHKITCLADDLNESSDQAPLVFTNITHTITLDTSGKPKLTIKSASEAIPDLHTKIMLFDCWLHRKKALTDYADFFILNGHDVNKINMIFLHYPDLENVEPTKHMPSILRKISPTKNTQFRGEKIFAYIGKHFNGYVENLLANIDNYLNAGKECFDRLIELFEKMNRQDFVSKALIIPHNTTSSVTSSTVKKAFEHLQQFSLMRIKSHDSTETKCSDPENGESASVSPNP